MPVAHQPLAAVVGQLVEGRISVAKRRHGLARCRYEGLVGMNRWVALGVIAKNIVNIGRAMEKQTAA